MAVGNDPETEPRIDMGGEDTVVMSRRNGTLWTAIAHVITAVIGSGVLSLAWAIAQLGWIAGPVLLMLFGSITYYTATMLAESYRCNDPETGESYRCPSYISVVRAHLGPWSVSVCGFLLYLSLAGTNVGYTITASRSLTAIQRANCYHTNGRHAVNCTGTPTRSMIIFGVVQIILSQIPNFHDISWLSAMAAVMSICYSSTSLVLGVAKTIGIRQIRGSWTGPSVGAMVQGQPVTLLSSITSIASALGNMAFAYSFSTIHASIQETLPSPDDAKVMKKATRAGLSVTTAFYLLVGCAGYAAFGDNAPGDVLTDFGFFEPFWVVDFANACLVLHLFGAYQVFAQPLFSFFEDWAEERFPSLHREFVLNLPVMGPYSFKFVRIVFRVSYVTMTTFVAILLPFFNAIMGLLGALGFFPLTIYFPIEIHKRRNAVRQWSKQWVKLASISIICLLISSVAAIASAYTIFQKSKHYHPIS